MSTDWITMKTSKTYSFTCYWYFYKSGQVHLFGSPDYRNYEWYWKKWGLQTRRWKYYRPRITWNTRIQPAKSGGKNQTLWFKIFYNYISYTHCFFLQLCMIMNKFDYEHQIDFMNINSIPPRTHIPKHLSILPLCINSTRISGSWFRWPELLIA